MNGKMEQWQAGYEAAKNGDLSKEPVIAQDADGFLKPTGDLTFGLGWAMEFMLGSQEAPKASPQFEGPGWEQQIDPF